MNQTIEQTQPSLQAQRPTHALPRRGKEPFEVVLRRFNREVQQSGLMADVKQRRFYKKEPSRTIRRQVAIVQASRRKAKRGY